MTSRPWSLAALALLTACAQPPATLVAVTGSPAPSAAAPAAPGDAPASPPAPQGVTAPGDPAATPGAVTPLPVAGGSGGGGSGPAAPTDSVVLPAGTGQKSVFVPGRVPTSIELTGSGLTVHLHAEGAVGEPTGGVTTLSGSVASGEADLIVQYVGPGRTSFVGGRTDAAGAFQFDVPMTPGATEAGVLIVREASAWPRLAIARVSLTDGQAASAGALTLAAPLPAPVSDPIPDPYHVLGGGSSTDTSVPTPGAGLAVTGAALQLAEPGAWRATVLTSSAAVLPRYDWPGFTPVVSYMAASGDGLTATETSGPVGGVPAFLAAPDLSGVAGAIGPGSAIAWPAVAGASLYTVRLVPVGQEDSPVWEGLVVNPRATIPTQLTTPAQPLVLELDAWDAPDVTPYSIASVRQLRIPTGPKGPTGRHSWTRRTVSFTP